ncbi:serine hydrolase [Streptomyces sp. NPDC044571]|uniref:D-alanyl-D-alanine carboxypeptidase n=1 Tax=Streptomyces sp. NPDC044571 TaxID=3155371 RepID=UPI0034018D4F
MKAMTVAGGSSDDPEREVSTTTGAAPDDTPREEDTEDVTEADADGALLTRGADSPGDEPEDRAEAGEPEPARDTARQETDAGADRTGAVSTPAPQPDAAGTEAASSGAKAGSSAGSHANAAAETGGTTGRTQSARRTATPADTPKAKAEIKPGGTTDRSPAVARPTADNAAEPPSAAEDNADTEAGAAQAGTEAEPAAAADKDTEAKAGQGADDTQVLAVPARTAAKPNSDTGADDTEATSPEPKASAPGKKPKSGTRPAPETEANEQAAGKLTLTEPTSNMVGAGSKAGSKPAPDAEAPAPDAAAASSEPGGGPRPTAPESDEAPTHRTGTPAQPDEKADRTLTLSKPVRDTAKAGTKPTTRAEAPDDGTKAGAAPAPTADAATETSRDGSKARRDANKEARPSVGAEGAEEPGDGSDAPGDQRDTDADTSTDTGTTTDTSTEVKPKPKPTAEGEARKVPAWARGQDSDSERTSQFVALKPLDVPAPAAARPEPQPQAPAPATPKPPLDLLAELTNTPAPPETPRRTALRRIKVWTPILLLLAGAYAGAQLLRPLPTPQVVATETDDTVDGQFSIPWPAKGQGAVRVPGSGDVGTFGEQKPVPTASVAKVMTAYVILKGHPLRKNDPGPDITIDAKAVADGNAENESRIQGLTAGTKFSQQDMLKMLMIPSGNNAARLLARWDTGSDSEAAFVDKMNAAARDLGMNDTTYTDPSGLDAGTVSTATDQVKLAEAVMKDEVFRAIVAMPSAPIKGLAQPLINNNELLGVQGLSVRGIKTGSSTPAGGALMWAAYKSVGDETPLILGTLMEQRVEGPDPNATKSLALVQTNSKRIIEAVRTALASTPLVRKGDTVGHVDDGLGGRTPLVATRDLNVIGVPGQQFKLTVAAAAGASPLPHKAKAGTEVATLKAGDGEGAKSVPVAVKNALPEPSFVSRLTRLG